MPPKMADKGKAKPPAVERLDTDEFFAPKTTSPLLDPAAMKKAAESRASQPQLAMYARAAALLTLLAAYSHVTLLTLSPVYGGIPSGVQHTKMLMLACFAGWAGNVALRRTLPVKTATLLPYVAMYIPVVQFYLFPYSEALGPVWGPRVTEGLTLFPLAMLTTACLGDLLEDADVSAIPKFMADATPGVGSWVFFQIVDGLVKRFLQKFIGQGIFYTRVAMQTMLAGAYAVFAPSKYMIVTIPAMIHAVSYNTHLATPAATMALNETLQTQGWMLLDRRESTTGYISVLESLERGFRVMRCDHSILGGEWTMFQGEKVSEPIYGVFAMLEAVRLVETKQPVADKDAKALVVGLGIGTTPSALVSHGIDTTVVEIDPVVYDYAVKYFGLRENSPAVIEDAVRFTTELAQTAPATYDYIVHDVFTGGAEPVDLFTLEFLQRLSTLLKPNGVIAINYAGDFSLPTPQVIVKTIDAVFPACRIFRESPANQTAIDEGAADFTNMVIFCSKTASAEAPLKFRKPVEADYLQSRARRVFLEPKNEVFAADILTEKGVGPMRSNGTKKVTKWHEESARGHWGVMRMVMPSQIWEQW